MFTVQEKIQRLLWDKRFIFIPDNIEVPDKLNYLILKDLTLEDRNYYLLTRELELIQSKRAGVPTEDSLFNEAKATGFWTIKDDIILKDSDTEILKIEAELTKQKLPSRIKILQQNIEHIKKLRQNTEEKKQSFYINSAEYYTHEVAAFSLIRRVVFTPKNILLIPDDNAFFYLKQNYIQLLVFLSHSVLSEGVLEIKEIREIARSPEWRLLWTLQRSNLPGLFNRSIGDLTLNHRMLIYWSRIYDSAIECMEPADTETINNDARFDIWLENKSAAKNHSKPSATDKHQENFRILNGEYIEICICGAKDHNRGKGVGEQTQHASNCLYGTYRYYTEAEKASIAQQVYNRNPNNIRAIQEKEQQIIEKSGMIEEADLRKGQTRHILGMPQNIVK